MNFSNYVKQNPVALAFFAGLIWALIAMTVSRYWIVPTYIPSENGHILGDPLLYHNLALEQVKKIAEHGFNTFDLHYGGQGPSGVASLLYLIYPSPYLVLILNALLHAVACAAVTRLLMIWFSPVIALLATLPLITSPANMFWLAQINKESYAIAGCTLFFLGYTLALKHALARQFNVFWLLVAIVALFLVYVVRPHLNQMLMLGFICAQILVLGILLLSKRRTETLIASVHTAVLIVSLSFLSHGVISNDIERKVELEETKDYADEVSNDRQALTIRGTGPENQPGEPSLNTAQNVAIATQGPIGVICQQKLEATNWQNASWLPVGINVRIKMLATQRCHDLMIRHTHDNPTTKQSIADTYVSIESTQDMITYAPRALQLGFFAPLPSQWPSGTFLSSFFYTTVPVMMVFFYLGMIATIVWVIRSKAWLVLPIFVISVVPLWVYGISTSFLGALFRYRYPVWIVLFCISMAALLTLLFVKKIKTAPKPKN